MLLAKKMGFRGPASSSDYCFGEDSDLHLEHYTQLDGTPLETTVVYEGPNGVWEFSMEELEPGAPQYDDGNDSAEAMVTVKHALLQRFGSLWRSNAEARGRLHALHFFIVKCI